MISRQQFHAWKVSHSRIEPVKVLYAFRYGIYTRKHKKKKTQLNHHTFQLTNKQLFLAIEDAQRNMKTKMNEKERRKMKRIWKQI